MANISFRIVVDDEYVTSHVPFATSKDVTSAITRTVNTDDVDVDWVTENVTHDLFNVLTALGGFGSHKIEISAHDSDNGDVKFAAIQCTPSSLGTVGYVKVDNELMDCISYVYNVIKDDYPTLLIKFVLSKPSDLMDSLDKVAKVMSGKHSTISDSDDIDTICKKIAEETKAEIIKPKETLSDYVCNDLLKQELSEIKDFFENRKVYQDYNITLPKGILFKGPPGTGKTYAARCIAGSVDCYFMVCTASALQGMYIGSGAENIRNVFKGAKTLAQKSGKGTIVFIDELDSFGNREGHGGNAGGEEDRTINQLLAEMSGFEDDSDVMILAATNYPEKLDAALQRAGRFGRQITIEYPTSEERLNIITHYYDILKIKLESSVVLSDIAELTEGLTPAEIKEIANESAILAVRNKRSEIIMDDVNEAINKVITKNIRHPDPSDSTTLNVVTAHECGHVLAEIIYNNTVPIKVTNYAYGDAGGFTQPATRLTGIVTRDRMLAEIKMLLGGRAAEEVHCGYITTGASSDLSKAMAIMENYFKVYHFESYESETLKQKVLDKVNELYNEVVNAFKDDKYYKCLQTLIDDLKSKRTLMTADITARTMHLRKGVTVC